MRFNRAIAPLGSRYHPFAELALPRLFRPIIMVGYTLKAKARGCGLVSPMQESPYGSLRAGTTRSNHGGSHNLKSLEWGGMRI